MNWMNFLSLLLEILVVLLGLRIAVTKRKFYGWLIALTFSIYVLYDLSRFTAFNLPSLDMLFLVASASICLAVWILAGKKL